MIRQCAWCLVMQGEVAPFKDKSITHGICKKCQKDMTKKIEQMEQK